MQPTVTLSKMEYDRLRQIAERFVWLQKFFQQDFFAKPPTKDVKEIMKGFQATAKYTPAFLESLERGLKESSYFSGKK